ncbi:MAG: hypothetical protein QM775_34570 [Pirellulales bacterium]
MQLHDDRTGDLAAQAAWGRRYLQLVHPDLRQEPVMVDALGGDKYALVLRDLPQRGVYRVVAREADAAVEGSVTEKTLYELPLAVAGPESESRLAAIERDAAMAGVDTAKVRWLGPQDEIGTAGATVRGQYLWKWLMAGVLLLLLAELAVIRWMRPTMTLRTPSQSGSAGKLEPLAAGSGAHELVCALARLSGR